MTLTETSPVDLLPADADAEDSPQSEFERRYISSTEICDEIGVTRAAVMVARRTGKLPNAIEINQGRLFLWEREFIRPFLEAWKSAR